VNHRVPFGNFTPTMTSDGKLSPAQNEEASFFEGDASSGSSSAVLLDEPALPARPSISSVASSADDEFGRVPDDIAPDFDEDAVLGRKRGLHVSAFLLVLVASVGGGTAAYMYVRKDASKDGAVASVSLSASAKSVAAPTNSAAPTAVAVSAEPSAKTTKTSATGGRSKAGSSGESAGIVGANPGAVPNGPGAAPMATGELTAGEVSGVVDRNRPLIKRRCWQPEVSARQGMGGSARVNASFTIGPSGAVQSASASGAEDDYPGLSSCIAARIREWKFPASASSTPVKVPFVFAAQ
jgi:hypothetical protein